MPEERIEDTAAFAEAAQQWRSAHKPRAAAEPEPNGHAEPLHSVSAVVYAGSTAPPRRFLDAADLLPVRNVVLLSGDGGTGKSLLALQLALACATASAWLGIAVDAGVVVYVSAEDDEDEMRKRLDDIAQAEGLDPFDMAPLQLVYMAGEDAVLASEDKRTGLLRPSQLYARLDALLAEHEPLLLVLDNLADMFAGNENNRSLVKQFVGLLRRLAIRHDCVVLLLGHPSLSGLASGTGMSGSTAWNNSVRARLYLRRVVDADSGHEADEKLRELEVMKANYGPKGEPIGLAWENGRFVRKNAPKPFDGVTVAHLEQVAAEFGRREWRADERSGQWGGYFVAELLDLDVGRLIGKEERTAEQERARKKVRKLLSTWIANKALKIVSRFDEHRKPREFYTP